MREHQAAGRRDQPVRGARGSLEDCGDLIVSQTFIGCGPCIEHVHRAWRGTGNQTGSAHHHHARLVLDLQGSGQRGLFAGLLGCGCGCGHIGFGGGNRGGGLHRFERGLGHARSPGTLRHDRRQRAIRVGIQQHGTARRAPLGDRFVHLVGDHLVERLGGGQNAGELLDTLLQIIAFGLKLDTVHLGQSAQTQVEDVLSLDLVQIENDHQTALRGIRIIRGADYLNHLVDVQHGQQQALDQVQAFQRLLLAIFTAAANHHTAVVHPHLEHLLQTHRVRAALHQRHVVHGEVVLQRCVLEQLHQNRMRVETSLDFDDDTRAVMTIGQIERAGNPLQLAVLHTVGNTFDYLLWAHHVRQLGDHDGLLAGRDMLDMRGGARGERTTAGGVGFTDAVAADDRAAGGPVGAGHVTHQLFQGGVRMRHEELGGVYHLAQIVGGQVRGHAHGDARAAVDQQIWDGGRQHGRFLELVVIVRREVDGILIDIRVHAESRRAKPGLGVTGGRRAVIQRAEVAVAVYQRQTHRERLCQTHHGLVDRGITVRVELAHHLAHHAGGLHIRAVGSQVHLAHLVDDAALHRLQAIARIGQCACVNHRIRILEEGLAHLLVQRRLDDMLLDRARIVGLRGRFAV